MPAVTCGSVDRWSASPPARSSADSRLRQLETRWSQTGDRLAATCGASRQSGGDAKDVRAAIRPDRPFDPAVGDPDLEVAARHAVEHNGPRPGTRRKCVTDHHLV